MRLIAITLCSLFVYQFTHAALVPTTGIIPSPYKIDRHGHATGAAAAWNPQNLFGGALSAGTNKKKSSGVENKEDTGSFSLYTYQHHDPLSVEVSVSKEKEDDNDNPATKSTNTEFDLRLGSKLSETPMTLGMDLSAEKDLRETSGFSSTTNKSRGMVLSASYKLDESYFAGAGIIFSKDEPDGGPTDKDESFYVGGGYIKDDVAAEATIRIENEEGIKEYTIIAQGALARGDEQFVGEFIFFTQDTGTIVEKFDLLVINGGYYFDLEGPYYVQPELGLQRVDGKTANSKYDTATILASVEAGIRTEKSGLYFVIGKQRGETEPSGPSSDVEFESSLVEIGMYAYF